MKTVILVLFVAVCGVAYGRPDATYTTKYDNIDLDNIIRNDRLLRNYIDCALGKGKCTKDGEVLKKLLPDAIQTGCSKCSEAQKRGAKKMTQHLIKNKRSWWDELEAKYDPSGEYRKKYEEELKKEGITLS